MHLCKPHSNGLSKTCPESVHGSTCVISELRLECYCLLIATVYQIQGSTVNTNLLSVSKHVVLSSFSKSHSVTEQYH